MRRRAPVTNSEWKIMTLLWDKSPRTMTEIVSALSEDTGWSKHTVISFLNRLEQKGSIHHEDGERAKEYFPMLRRDYARMAEAESFLDRVFAGSFGMMINSLYESDALTDDDIDTMRRIIHRIDA